LLFRGWLAGLIPVQRLHISVPTLDSRGPRDTVTATIDVAGRSNELSYTFWNANPIPSGDAFVAAVLLPAMLHGLPIVSEAPVSARLLRQLEMIQDIYASWVPRLRRVTIMARGTAANGSRSRDAASFFTGGIDSSYTVLTRNAEIESLIYVHGFASPSWGQRRERAGDRLRQVARMLRKRLVEVETNLAARLDEWLDLEKLGHLSPDMYNFELAHGAALASVALLLQGTFGRIYLAGSHTYRDLFPWGSHPLLDPLWSTERLDLVHDGSAATRVDKARVVGQSGTALDALWVCTEEKEGGADAPNCGRCEKCVRTLINLRIVGARGHRAAFAEPLDLYRVSLLRAPAMKPFLRENLAAAEAAGTDPALVRALRRALNPWSPSRIGMEIMLAGWKLVQRVLPLERRAGRLRWNREAL